VVSYENAKLTAKSSFFKIPHVTKVWIFEIYQRPASNILSGTEQSFARQHKNPDYKLSKRWPLQRQA